MDAAGQGDALIGPQLAAQLSALKGIAPEPACYVVFRATRHADGTETCLYEVPDQQGSVVPSAWPQWLARRNLLGREQLRVAVLVIREAEDANGCLMECALERRRGAVDGPFWGDPARIEFVGAAQMVRLYRALGDGRLQEIAPSPQVAAPHAPLAEPLAGERLALERRFGHAFQVLDRRDPTLFEDVAGLSAIMHLRLADGRPLACGIGWFGTAPFTLVADFPRFSIPPQVPPADEAAVQEALRRLALVRHETRLDERGFAVMARRPGTQSLYLLRVANGRVKADPYRPGASGGESNDQRRWFRYAEAHAGLTLLDRYRDGASDGMVVLTGDAGGHVWRHLIDADGVEVWRVPADDAAVAVLHRERLSPGTLARLDAMPHDAPRADAGECERITPHPDSLLDTVCAFDVATAALQVAGELAAAPPDRAASADLFGALHALAQALETLSAEHAASQIEALVADMQAGRAGAERLQAGLARMEAGLQDELALIRIVSLQPRQWRRLNETAPFGATVEVRFPGCAYDIEEAASCLAFRRSTAAVFHCAKVLERGLRALGRRAELSGFPAMAQSWSETLAALRQACPTELGGVLPHLQRIRRRWHATGLAPAEKYTEAEAEQVFHLVGAFMRELAAKCDEAGSPVAEPDAAPE